MARVRGHQTIPVDGAKLISELAKRNVSQAEACEAIGYSDTFLQHVRSRGNIRPLIMETITKLYDIKYDDVKPEEKPVVPVETVTEKPQADTNDLPYWDHLTLILYETIYKAVTDALSA